MRKTFSQHYSFFFLSNLFLPTQISSRKTPIEICKGLPFSVDTWTSSSKRKRHHFLTHAHKDHSFGISSQFSFPIYSTLLPKTLVLQHYPQVCLSFQGFFFFLIKIYNWVELNFVDFMQLDDSLFVEIDPLDNQLGYMG